MNESTTRKEQDRAIRRHLQFLTKTKNPSLWQLKQHQEESAAFASLLDKRILDCEHVILLSQYAQDTGERYQKAISILGTTLRLRAELKQHSFEVTGLVQKDKAKKILKKDELVYHVRVLQDDFGDVLACRNGQCVQLQSLA